MMEMTKCGVGVWSRCMECGVGIRPSPKLMFKNDVTRLRVSLQNSQKIAKITKIARLLLNPVFSTLWGHKVEKTESRSKKVRKPRKLF